MRYWLPLFACAVVACGAENRTGPACSTDLAVIPPTTNVDIVFVVDNTPGMAGPLENALEAAFPTLLQQLNDLAASGYPASYHIGIITTDLGAGPTPFAICKPGGDGGRLQALGIAHGPNCQPPAGRVPFIDYDLIHQTNNAPAGQSVPATFTCMASGGDIGCPFQSQLEAPYRVLHDDVVENAGFLRPDSIVAVFLFTTEDDCSAPPDTDLFEASTADYGALHHYRCNNYGVVCAGQLMPYGASGGPLANCMGAPNPGTLVSDSGNSIGSPPAGQGKLMDVGRYLDFFGKTASHGGLRADPADVILVAADGPASPVQTVVASELSGQPCPAGSTIDGTSCAVMMSHSCTSSPGFFAAPAVRIGEVITGLPNSYQLSICDAAVDFAGALTQLGQAIGGRLMRSPVTDGGVACP